MQMLRRAPAPPLDALIDCLWHAQRLPKAHARERALPTGRVDLVIHLAQEQLTRYADAADLHGQRYSPMLVSGAGTRHFVIDTSRPSLVVGVHFHAGGAAALLGLPASELSEQHVALEELWGAAARRLREQLLAAGTPQQRLDRLEAALLARYQPDARPDAAVRHALRSLSYAPGEARIAALQAASGLSAQRFIASFNQQVGLTPKRYARVLRFKRVIERAAASMGAIDWVQLALDAGYHDQPHLVHDFRAFSGLSPTQYQPAQAQQPSHVAIR